jgi:hypothetical protein
MKTKLMSNKFKLTLASLLAIASLFLVAAVPAYAAKSDGPIKPVAVAGRYTDTQLTATFFHDQTRLNWLRGNIMSTSSLYSPEV